MQRRTLLATGAALAAPRIASAQVAARTLRFIPQSNLASVDPVWSTAVIVRNHGLMIYDMLFGLDAALQPRHQMAQGHEGGTGIFDLVRAGKVGQRQIQQPIVILKNQPTTVFKRVPVLAMHQQGRTQTGGAGLDHC